MFQRFGRESVNGRTEGRTDGQTDGWTDRQMDATIRIISPALRSTNIIENAYCCNLATPSLQLISLLVNAIEAEYGGTSLAVGDNTMITKFSHDFKWLLAEYHEGSMNLSEAAFGHDHKNTLTPKPTKTRKSEGMVFILTCSC